MSHPTTNLNKFVIRADERADEAEFEDPSCSSKPVVSVYFRNAMDKLVEKIGEADYVLGCVAWLTNTKVLTALSKCPNGTTLVVSKEDWLRPDTMEDSLKTLYSQLKGTGDLFRDLPFHTRSLRSISSSGTLMFKEAPVRCFGHYNEEHKSAWPRLHHKFILFGKMKADQYPPPIPYAVWTGSLNLTHNSENSLENGVYITDPEIVTAFTREFTQIYAASESLDWKHVYSTPDFRIGT